MRGLYTVLFAGLLPLILLRLYWRGIKAPAYRQRWRERLGFYREQSAGDVIWLHAVSVGEAEAIFPLIKLIQARHGNISILVTTTTPTGSARVKSILGDSVEHVYLPYDLPWVVERFVCHFRPRLAVFVEKEIWPNLFERCRRSSIPVLIVNARLSAKSAPGYKKIAPLIVPALNAVDLIATQTVDDARRFIDIGACDDRVRVFGNIKFDINIDASVESTGKQLKAAQFSGRFVLIAASTHHGEEAVILALYRKLKAEIPELLLLIAPRHPERFQSVKNLCDAEGLAVITRSSGMSCNSQTDIYLVDSIGELKMLYAASDLAFVGGSLVAVGGHNVLEPAVLGIPVLFGRHMFNFEEIALQLLQAKAARQCVDESELYEVLLSLCRDGTQRIEMAKAARQVVLQNQGATQRVADLLETYC